MTHPVDGAALVLALDAGSRGPREVEHLIEGLAVALGARTAPTYASSHVVDAGDGVRHVGALVWERPPWQVDLVSVAHRVLPPGDATVCRMTRHGARLAGGRNGGSVAVLVAATEAATGARGRVVSFPGQAAVTGLLTVGELTDVTAVDAVVGLAGTPVTTADLVDTGGWLRPRWLDGRLELLVERAPGGLLRPFEVREQVACCTAH